ncbi:hypothetical protein DICVIV_05713 [Dictyocaulus viviparus]|uniref:Leucine Rich repeat-containing domain protein n=1 Tax=Dictyocaulus viviparus TaxID=29172 RepID=A0A0D8XUM2_DICVI|nr:hypothetical protein DICVIV_05713 [Dictyocaulus viviparus]
MQLTKGPEWGAFAHWGSDSVILQQIATLEELVMPQNGITVKGIEALAKSFISNPSLRVVNLNDNTVTETGSYALAMALPSLPKLEVLNLGDCLCRDQGCHSVVDSLSPVVHRNLKEVDLSGSELSGAAAMKIIEKWRKFSSAVCLTIASNNLGQTFELIRNMAPENVQIGDSGDDQGSCSSSEEELRSVVGTSDDEKIDETPSIEEDSRSNEVMSLIKSCEENLERVQDQFESATQEEAARLLLELANIITRSGENCEVIEMAYNVAQNVLHRVQTVRRKPISATSQVLNNLVAQAGFVKCEEKWDIPIDNASLSLLLNQLVARGYFLDQRDIIGKYL